MNLLAIVLMLSCLPSALIDFAMPKWKADKNVRIEDTYKWLYQATRGGEHAAPDREMAKQWLDGEWSGLSLPQKGEPLWDPLCPGGEIGRLNLRPFKTRGGSEDDILAAFLTASREYRSTVSSFTDAWLELGKRLRKKSLGQIDRKAWDRLDGDMKAKDYPAIHHSSNYEKANNPAYRILTAGEMRKLIAKLKQP
ncbi:MAG: hypothetical protein ACKVQJ_08850 [Pyrinomonadaceae bacterium]